MKQRTRDIVMLERHAIGVVVLAVLLAMTIMPAAADMKYPDMQSQWRNPTAGAAAIPGIRTSPWGSASRRR